MTTLDIDFVRAQFPAFEQENLRGWGFFENAGGSYACKQVIDRLTRYYRETKLQPYGPYPAAQRAGKEMDSARARLAALLNVETGELSFGPSTSQNTYVLANAFASNMKAGDEIIVTNQDHEANSGVWRRLEGQGVTVREWQVDPQTGSLDLDDLESLLNEHTKLVTMPHCSNIVAEINDVAAAAKMTHDAGAVLVVDGVSFAPHGLPDITATGADIYLFSLYKTFGPHQGAMVVRNHLHDKLVNQGHYFNADYSDKRFTPAGPDHAQISAINGLVDYYETIYAHHFDEKAEPTEQARQVNALFVAHERELAELLLNWLRTRNDIRILGPVIADNRAATIALQTNRSALDIATELADHKIMAGASDFYAVRLLEAMNVPTGHTGPCALRLSFVHYTSKDEIDQLISALDKVL
ncbi:Cysteine desulfurase [hydrothermal vent metagenome]|uniref:Cysteine desulfurase n=1 Tax=hydrothermal vent metagenome TaxID=652676 RepID=A0A3B0RR85_9ZZZZ